MKIKSIPGYLNATLVRRGSVFRITLKKKCVAIFPSDGLEFDLDKAAEMAVELLDAMAFQNDEAGLLAYTSQEYREGI